MKHFVGQARQNKHDRGGVSDYAFSEYHRDPQGKACVMLRGTFTVDELRALVVAIENGNTKEFKMQGEIVT